MSIYIHRNNEQFGPYTLDQIRIGLDKGALLGADLAWEEGMPDWQPLSALLPRDHGAPPRHPPNPAAYPPSRPAPVYSASSRLAVASLVSGCVIFVLSLPMLFLAFVTGQIALLFSPLTAGAAVILGHTGVGAINVSAGRLTGKRMAVAGIILGYTGIALAIALIAVFLLLPHKLTRAREKELATRTLAELKMLDNAIDAYALYSQKPTGDPVTPGDLKGFLNPAAGLSKTFRDPLGHEYGPFTIGTPPKVPRQTYDALSDVAGSPFWSPYY